MKKMITTGLFLFLLSNNVHAYLWSSAKPKEVHIVPDGLVLIGDFDNTGVICATGTKAIFLPRTDTNYKAKLSLALTALATNKKIKVLINDPIEANCTQIPFIGNVPIAFHYYWQLKN